MYICLFVHCSVLKTPKTSENQYFNILIVTIITTFITIFSTTLHAKLTYRRIGKLNRGLLMTDYTDRLTDRRSLP